MITVLGISGGELILSEQRERVQEAQLLAGGARQLALFPQARAERFAIGNNIPELVARLQCALLANEGAVVLASGDPLLYGIGATLRRYFTAQQLEIVPAVSSVQWAFAAVGEPWHDAALLSAHGRPLVEVLRELRPLRKAAVLTDSVNTPAEIARQLLPLNGDCPAAVCERLGLPEQRVFRGALSDIARQTFDPLNVMLILPEMVSVEDVAFGLRDDALEHDGLITHLESRAVAIALMQLKPDSLVWDIGAGSGSIALDAARVAHRGLVFAVEREAARYARLCRNIAAQHAARVRAVYGEAPIDCADWPAADAVFVGGGGDRLADIFEHVALSLQPGGRVVVNLVTLERVSPTLELLRSHGWAVEVTQVNVARSRPLQGNTYLDALNPVFILAAGK